MVHVHCFRRPNSLLSLSIYYRYLLHQLLDLTPSQFSKPKARQHSNVVLVIETHHEEARHSSVVVFPPGSHAGEPPCR